MMDEEVSREKADEAFERRREEMRKKDEEKTGKNRKRREKNKKKKAGTDGDHDGAKYEIIKGDVADSLTTSPGREQDKGPDVDDLPATTAEDVGVIIHDDD